MMRLASRPSRPIGLVPLLVVLAAAPSCSRGGSGGEPPEVPEESLAETEQALAENRVVVYARFPTGGGDASEQEWSTEQAAYLLLEACQTQLWDLGDGPPTNWLVASSQWITGEGACGNTAILRPPDHPTSPSAQWWITTDASAFGKRCVGQLALQIAGSVKTQYLVDRDNRLTLVEDEVRPSDAVRVRIPPQQATHAASWALLATDMFRASLKDYVSAANIQACLDRFEDTPPGGDGPTFGEFLASGLVDAMTSMVEAAETAQKHALAAANAKRGTTEQDAPEANVHAWRDRHDSRLEVASIYAPISGSRYEPADASGISSAPGLFPVATLLPGSKSEKRAEELLRSTRANPCLTGMGTWCAEALSGISSRTAANLWTDIATLLGSAGGNAATSAGQSALLTKSGVTLADLERAAQRLVREAEVLGRAIVPDPDAPPRVLGTSAGFEKPSPYYLYATTAGRVPWEMISTDYIFPVALPATAAWPTVPGSGYFDRSIIAAADLASIRLDGIVAALTPSASYTAMLAQARGYARELAPSQARLRIVPSATSQLITSARLELVGLPFTGTATEISQQWNACNVWLGEAGLECGLTDSYDGVRCDPNKYRLGPSGLTWETETWTGGASGSISIAAASVPLRPWIAATRTLRAGDRLYVICNLDQAQSEKREVLFATELTYPGWSNPSSYEWRAYLPPMSAATLDALSDTLAADPSSPADGGLSCAGVPRNVRLALEDEITEAFTGQDNIESSFAYYLKLAREAADRADQLGEQLVEQGLQMDIRAEQARDELEDLCGGVVDVATLRQYCPVGQPNCSILQLLEGNLPGATVPASVDTAGVARCLGVLGKPTHASVGDEPLCLWKYNGSTPTPPMVCPIVGGVEAAACANLPKVPAIAGNAEDAADCAALLSDAPLQAPVTALDPVRKTLNLVVTNFTPASGAGPDLGCFHSLATMRLAQAGVYLPVDYNPNWTTQRDLSPAASAIGYEEDIFGFPSVTVNGRAWMRFGDGTNGPRPVANMAFWPCQEHAALGSQDGMLDLLCGLGGEQSLFCGPRTSGFCSDMGVIGRRLRDAVGVLKGVTGAEAENVIRREYEDPQTYLAYGDMQQGVQPPWMIDGLPGLDYWLSNDRRSMAWWCPAGACRASLQQAPYTVRSPKDDLNSFNQGWGFIPATLLWGNENCSYAGDQLSQVLGCGDMRRLLALQDVPTVRSQVRVRYGCPTIPHKKVSFVEDCVDSSMNPNATCAEVAGQYVLDSSHPISGFKFERDGVSCFCRRKTQKTLADVHAELRPGWESNRAYANFADELRKYECREHIMGTALRRDTVMDALELSCAAQLSGNASCTTLLQTELDVESVEDFPKVQARIQCAADSLQETIDRMYVLDVPEDVVDAIAAAGAVQTYPQYRGEYGEIVAQLGGRLLGMRRQSDVAVQQLRQIGELFGQARTSSQITDLNIASSNIDAAIAAGEYRVEELHHREQQIRTRQAIANHVTNCVNAVAAATSWGDAVFSGGSKIIQAAATCANSGVQIKAEMDLAGLSADILDVKEDIQQNIQRKIELGQQISEAERLLVMQRVAADVAQRVDNLHLQFGELKEAQAEVHSLLARLDGTRNKAKRAASKVLMLENDDLQRSYGVTSTMLARMNTLRIRYERARDDAVRLSFLARRAVEQRLGVDMSLMEDDMTLVAAPRSWVDELCTTSGIDYNKVRTGGTLTVSASDAGAVASFEEGESPEGYDYADAYVGDWLTKLENFVESYRLDYPFQDGGDVAVVSIRDEIVRARRDCEQPGWNQLYFTSGLMPESAVVADVSGGSPAMIERAVWDFTCRDGERPGLRLPRADEDESPFRCDDAFASGSCRPLGDAKPVRLWFNSGQACVGAVSTTDGGALPSAGLVYRYRADQCTATAQQGQPVCTDLDAAAVPRAAGTPLVQDWGQPISLAASAIGTRPALSVDGTGLSRAASPTTYAAYTMSFVFRQSSPGSAYLGAHWGVPSGSQQPLTQLALGDASGVGWMHSVVQLADHLTSDSRQQTVFAMGHVAPPARPTMGDILTVRGGPQGVELYLNGALRSRGPQAALATAFGGLPLAGGGALLLAEAVAYGRWLDDAELQALHANLAGYYGVAIEAPAYWLSGDALFGAGAPAGYSFPAGAIYDAASGLARQDATPALEARSLVAFGTSSRALSFSAGEQVTFQPLSRVDQIETEGGSLVTSASTVDEYAVTVVANCQAGSGLHRIFSTHDSPTMTRTMLEVDGATGRVQYRDVLGTTAQTPRASAAGVVTCGVPFVITLRGSTTLGTTEIFVNGAKVVTQASYLLVSLAPRFGAMDGESFLGTLADGMVHVNAMSDAQLSALHVQLAAKYGINLGPSGVAGGSALATSGPPRVRQAVSVGADDYWLSWYQHGDQPPLSVYLEMPDGTAETLSPTRTEQNTIWPDNDMEGKPSGARESAWIRPPWVRQYVSVTVPRAGTMYVGFLPTIEGVWLAAPQLEHFDQAMSSGPKEFFPTTDKLTRPVASCQDSRGEVFRGMWTEGDEYYCPPGLGVDCASDGDVRSLPKRHYRELKFPLSLEAIERGELMSSAGFAKGNFNYRFDQLAINVVGTAVKDCEKSDLPATCYAANFAQYSLHHSAPFRIRNYDGDVVDAPLFGGNIQQAKGLLAERYVTNPVSSADDTLLRDYWRDEFKGRPIDGNFTLRVYEDGGLDFEAIEDVQLAIRYRYWTRFER